MGGGGPPAIARACGLMSARTCSAVYEERHVTRALERRGEHPLMLGAGAALATRVDLAAVADVAANAPDLFEVDLLDLVDAERADLATWTTGAAVAGTLATTISATVTAAVVAVAATAATAAARAAAGPTGTILAHLCSFFTASPG